MSERPDLGSLPPPSGVPNSAPQQDADEQYLPFLTWGFGHFAAALAVGLLIGPILGLLAYSVIASPETAEDVPTLFLLAAQSLTSFGVLIFFSLRQGTGSWRNDFGFALEPRHLWWFGGGMVLQIAVALLSYPLVEAFSDSDGPQQEIAQLATELSGAELAMFGLLVGVLAPIFEEVVFRGILLARLVKSMSKRWAAVISAAAFAAIHLADPNAILVVPGLFVIGLVLAYTAYRSKNLSIPIFIHMGVNSLAVLLLGFADELEEAAESIESVIRLAL